MRQAILRYNCDSCGMPEEKPLGADSNKLPAGWAEILIDDEDASRHTCPACTLELKKLLTRH